jgi:hypothetical protein
VANRASAYDTEEFPDHPLYNGNPWFLPAVGSWYRFRDTLERGVADIRNRWMNAN